MKASTTRPRPPIFLAALVLLLLVGLGVAWDLTRPGVAGRLAPPPTRTAAAAPTAPVPTVTRTLPAAPSATATAAPQGATGRGGPIPAISPTPTPGLHLRGLTPLPAGTAPGNPTVPATTGPPAAPTATPLPVETPEPGAWLTRYTAHYDLYYLPNSPAAQDSARLATIAERAMSVAVAHTQITPTVRIRIYFVNRIYWQGGASYSHNELLISYPPAGRDYTSTSLEIVLRHETTHALIEQMLGSAANKGGLLGEGVAVWSADGHYQIESIGVLASTLVAENSDLYIPLASLRQDFYGAQHEIAYLEGGSYDEYLIDRWGLDKFKQYLAQPDNPAPIYGQDSAQLEADWRAWLAGIPHSAADVQAVRLRVRYYDLMRRYESTLDPDARILPPQPPSQWGPTLIRIFSAPASGATNVAIEQTFVQAGQALWSGDLTTCARLLDQLDGQIPAGGS